jgi:prepilin peptidase CpaA
MHWRNETMSTLNASQELLAMAVHPRTGVLSALLVAAAIIDWRTRRIPNWLTVGGLVYALAYNAMVPPPLQGGLGWALAGAAVGLGVLLPLYVIRVMGAGDVKLMAMAGAFLGAGATLQALLFTLVAGGLAAVVFALYHRGAVRLARNTGAIVQSMAFAALAGSRSAEPLAQGASIGRMPYGVSICLGTIASLAARQLGYL